MRRITMYCTECGQKINEGDLFCRNCGCLVTQLQDTAKVADENTTNNVDTSPSPTKTKLRIPKALIISVVAIVAVIAVVCVVAVSIRNNKSNKSNSKNDEKYVDKTSDDAGYMDEQGDAVITKETEKEYIDRLKAYQDYFNDLKDEYSSYYICGNISLDGNGLPLLWVAIFDSAESENVRTTQLVGYEDKTAKVLAEKGTWLIATRGPLVMAYTVNNDGEYVWYLYDEDSKDFENVTRIVENETDEYTSEMLESVQFCDSLLVMYNERSNEMAYIGSLIPQYDTENSDETNEIPKRFTLFDGTTTLWSEVQPYYMMMCDDDWKRMDDEIAEYMDDITVDRLLRELQEKPMYTDINLYLYIASVVYGYDITKVDIDDYTISKASQESILEVIIDYIEQNDTAYTRYFLDDKLLDFESLKETEPYMTIISQGVEGYSYEDGIVTINCYNNIEYQFKVEFSKAGDKITAITYIDPYADLESWKSAYISALHNDTILLNDTCTYGLKDLNGDGIPEIYFYSDYNGYNTSIFTYDNGNVSELVYGIGLEICDNIIFCDDRYGMFVWRLEADNTVTDLINISLNDLDGSYTYNGARYTYDEMIAIVQDTLGINLDSFSVLMTEYEYDEIEDVIIGY